MPSILSWQRRIHDWAISKEWRGPRATARPLGIDLMLWTTEIAEAFECLRDNSWQGRTWESFTIEKGGVKFENLTKLQLAALLDINVEVEEDWLEQVDYAINELGLVAKPEGFPYEVADLLIRVFETCEEYGIDIEPYIKAKMRYNETRALRHGGKLM